MLLVVLNVLGLESSPGGMGHVNTSKLKGSVTERTSGPMSSTLPMKGRK